MGKPVKDLTGWKFGKLLVVRRAPNTAQGKARWDCNCDCGKDCIVNSRNLLRGSTKSCGCFRKETVSKRRVIDLTGQRFGRWLVLKEFGRTAERNVLWMCKCDCGIEKPVNAAMLRNGMSKSCGCLKSDNMKNRRREKHPTWKGGR